MNLSKVIMLATILTIDSAFGSWGPVSDEDLYCGAKLIVAGTLGDIEERYMHVTAKYGDDALHWYIDLGHIKEARVIKGEEQQEGDISVLFDSKGQTGPFSHTKVTHSEGESGIWIIWERDYYTGHYRLHKPTNPLPLSEEGKIRSTLKRCSK